MGLESHWRQPKSQQGGQVSSAGSVSRMKLIRQEIRGLLAEQGGPLVAGVLGRGCGLRGERGVAFPRCVTPRSVPAAALPQRWSVLCGGATVPVSSSLQSLLTGCISRVTEAGRIPGQRRTCFSVPTQPLLRGQCGWVCPGPGSELTACSWEEGLALLGPAAVAGPPQRRGVACLWVLHLASRRGSDGSVVMFGLTGSSTDISEDWEKDFDLDMTEEEVQLALSKVAVSGEVSRGEVLAQTGEKAAPETHRQLPGVTLQALRRCWPLPREVEGGCGASEQDSERIPRLELRFQPLRRGRGCTARRSETRLPPAGSRAQEASPGRDALLGPSPWVLAGAERGCSDLPGEG